MIRTVTKGIVLSRTDFGEADRILTILTPNHGRIRAIAKGVRKVKSKLAGGIELFSVSNITFIKGKSEINTLISTRLEKHFGNIAKDLKRTMMGYEILNLINKTIEDNADSEYFEMLEAALAGLDKLALNQDLIELWFYAQLLKLAGHSPNLATDSGGQKLSLETSYSFDIEKMSFDKSKQGRYDANHIKLLRLSINQPAPTKLEQIANLDRYLAESLQLIKIMSRQYLKV